VKTGLALALRVTLLRSHVTWLAPAGRLPGKAATEEALVLLFVPPVFQMLAGSGGTTGRCTSLMPAAPWQLEQLLSAKAAPPGWLAPVAQSMSSWHPLHAKRLGTLNQLSPWGVAVLAVWHFTQLRWSWG